MSNSPMKFDLTELVDGLRGMFANAVNGAASLGSPSAMDVRIAVMSVLKGDSKNGKEVIHAIQAASGGSWVPKSSTIYPLLEELTGEGILSVKIDKELRVYSLTKQGKATLAEALEKATMKTEKAAMSSGSTWLETSTNSLKAGAKLAQALSQVAQHGTPEQQARASKLVDETRRKVYAILAED